MKKNKVVYIINEKLTEYRKGKIKDREVERNNTIIFRSSCELKWRANERFFKTHKVNDNEISSTYNVIQELIKQIERIKKQAFDKKGNVLDEKKEAEYIDLKKKRYFFKNKFNLLIEGYKKDKGKVPLKKV